MSHDSGGIPPTHYIKQTLLGDGTGGTSTSIQGGSIPIWPDGITGVSFNSVANTADDASTDLVAAIKVEASNDPRASPEHPDHSSAVWEDVSTEFATTATTSGAGSANDNTSNIRHPYIRWKATRSSGKGTYQVYFTGKGVGG